jgi:hypothetical protein
MRPRTNLSLRAISSVALSAMMAACTVGPNYHRPTAPISTHFKEADGWRPSHPVDAIDKGAWWSVFNDPELDALERRVEISNQNIAQYVAAYREAHQITAEARASFFPTVSGSLGAEGEHAAAAAPWRPSAPGSAPRGRRTCGARSAAQSRATSPAPRPARRRSPTPACRPRANWPATTTACGSTTPSSSSIATRWPPIRSS